MKRQISILLIFSLLFYLTGCYSMQEVTKEEFSSQKECDEAKLIAKDNKKYQFNDGYYTINSDTLTGSGLSFSGNNETQFAGKIALNDVTSFNLDKLDVERTVLVSFIILVIVVAAIIDLNTTTYGFDWGS